MGKFTLALSTQSKKELLAIQKQSNNALTRKVNQLFLELIWTPYLRNWQTRTPERRSFRVLVQKAEQKRSDYISHWRHHNAGLRHLHDRSLQRQVTSPSGHNSRNQRFSLCLLSLHDPTCYITTPHERTQHTAERLIFRNAGHRLQDNR